MRRFGGKGQFGGSFSAGAVTANTVNITQITHVAQVVRPVYSNGVRAHRITRHGGHHARTSQLFRYMSEGRSSGELCEESVRTLGIAARGIGSGLGGMAHGVGKMAMGTVGLVAALFGKKVC